jgi:lipoate-protein ligase B
MIGRLENFRKITVVNLGLTEYSAVWELQQALLNQRCTGTVGDVLLLNEHHHVYTLGKSSDANHVLASDEQLSDHGVKVYHIDRGGDVTYHGPGQLVGYPILNLYELHCDVHQYLRKLEEVIIRTLSTFGINGHRDEGFTGVWVGNDKIAAIGVKVSHGITMHGFALNVNTDLSYFDQIIPCGIFHKGVTSIQQVLGRTIGIDEVSDRITDAFGEVFESVPVQSVAEELYRLKNDATVESSVCHQ